ncbi:hypothetical protein ACQKCH_01385 [Nubsella zeaxanthinifaciens]|uniref:hypothetical protein n=1 Tax=Nubsella zeaxanthinifaciens TaxID=392412 RepID=UPI003CFED310
MLTKYLTVGLICLGVFISLYSVVRNYRVKNCQNEYGVAYNRKRKALGIPLIPSYWHIKKQSSDFIWWEGNENVIGHKRKSVMFSGCSIYGELDVYNLPLKDGIPRLIEIEYRYGRNQDNDSISYTYQVGNSATVVSKYLIDSLFSVERIKKN